MSAERALKPRPYWHVDAKWITGLLLVFILSLAMLIFSLVQITARQPAVDGLTMALAIMYSRNGLDDETEIAAMRLQMQASPDKTIQPIPGLRITLREQDISGLSPREARLFFFRKWAEPIYQDGIKGLAALADDPELKSKILEGGALFNVLTLKTHQSLQRVLIIAGCVCLLLLILLIFFSYRFGRISNPGCVLVVASLPGVLLFTLVGMAIRPITTAPTPEAGTTGMISYLISNILFPLAPMFSRSYLVFLALGLGLLLLAVVSSIVWWLVQKTRLTHGTN